MKEKSIVLKIGGSLLYNDDMDLNVSLLAKILAWYRKTKKNHSKIVIVVGGGKLSRSVNDKVKRYLKDDVYQHGIAMQVTQVNALVIAGFLNDKEILSPEKLGDAYEHLMGEGQRILVCGGLKTGWSTDMDAAVFADVLGCNRVYKISDIDSLYTGDPKIDSNVKPIKDISWKEYAKMFGITNSSNGKPNAHLPIGVESVKFCMNKEISFHLSGGKTLKKIDSLSEVLSEGTFIHP